MAMKKSRGLTDAELRLTEVLWRIGPATVSEVAEKLPKDVESAYSTVLTTLRILETKGYLRRREDERAFVYEPVVGRDQARESAVTHLLHRFSARFRSRRLTIEVMRSTIILLLAILVCCVASGQSFEVATVKTAVMPDFARGYWVGRVSGGPGTADPGRYSCEKCDLYNLVLMAYDLRDYQLTAPDWMRSAGFDIDAKIPSGATPDQARLMLQNLLADRFKLIVHHQQKEMPASELTIARGGPKLKASTANPAAESPPPVTAPKLTFDNDGFPLLPQGRHFAMIMQKDGARMRVAGMSMQDFAIRLAAQTSRPVIDATGLPGTYDFTLAWEAQTLRANPGDLETSGPTLEAALQQQLGLRLESKKAPVDVVVIDHCERAPTEN
jgi:uncharacterized protein (TIGR03435 family)